MKRRRVAILISGRGSNMAALIAAARDDTYPAAVSLVISNRPEAPGLARAAAAGVATAVLDHLGFADRARFDSALRRLIDESGAELVACAGYMRIMTPEFVAAYAGRLINIHPALLPLYKGLDTHARALADGVRIHGCTVHFVTPEVDSGPIIAQAAVPVIPGDTPLTLAESCGSKTDGWSAATTPAASATGWTACSRRRCEKTLPNHERTQSINSFYCGVGPTEAK